MHSSIVVKLSLSGGQKKKLGPYIIENSSLNSTSTSNLQCLWTLILLELETSLFSNIAGDQLLSVATKVVGGRVSLYVDNYIPSIIPLIIKTF